MKLFFKPVFLLLLAAGSSLLAESLLQEDFEKAPLASTREGSAGKAGMYYSGRSLWQTAANGKAGPNGIAVETRAIARGNHWLYFDAFGSEAPEDSSVFRTSDWNPEKKSVLRISMRFRLDPGDQNERTWGALILTQQAGRYDLPGMVPGKEEQILHLRFHSSGKLSDRSGNLGWKYHQFQVGKGKVHTLQLLVNGSGAAVQGIPAGTAGLWLNGDRVQGVLPLDLPKEGRFPVSLNYLEFRAFGGVRGQRGDPVGMWIDDVSVESVVPVRPSVTKTRSSL